MADGKKNAYVHQLYQHKAGTELWGHLDWVKLIEKLEELPVKDRCVNEIILDPIRRDDCLLLGMLKPQAKDYLVELDGAGNVVDLMSAASDGDGDAPSGTFHTAVALLLPVGDAFAFAAGSLQSPRPPSVVRVVEAFHDRSDDYHWAHRPLLDRGLLQQLKDGAGVDRFTTSVDTNRTVFDSSESGTLMSAFEKVADVIGSDVQIDITISLPGSENSKTRRERFRDSIVAGVDRLIPSRSTNKSASAKVYSAEGYAEELELVEHKMQVAFDVAPAKSEQARYTALVDQLAAASEQIIEKAARSI